MESFVQQYWSIIMAAIGTIVWLVRLESKVTNLEKHTKENLEKRVDRIEEQHETLNQMALDIREIKTNMKWIMEQQQKYDNVP